MGDTQRIPRESGLTLRHAARPVRSHTARRIEGQQYFHRWHSTTEQVVKNS